MFKHIHYTNNIKVTIFGEFAIKKNKLLEMTIIPVIYILYIVLSKKFPFPLSYQTDPKRSIINVTGPAFYNNFVVRVSPIRVVKRV
jgi:hypothetical protein